MSNGNRIGPEYGPDYRHDNGRDGGQGSGYRNGEAGDGGRGADGPNGLDVRGPADDEPRERQQPQPYVQQHHPQQPEEYRPQPRPPHPQPTEGWGVGEYDADATAFVQLPTGGMPGADPFGPGTPGGYGDPLAAPGTGQGMYTPPSIDPSVRSGSSGYPDSAGGPMTPSATTDPAGTGHWSLPFAPEAPGAYSDAGANSGAGTGGLPGHEQYAQDQYAQQHQQQQAYPEQIPGDGGSAASAMGQGAAAALAGSHEARTRRPLGAGGGTLPEEELARPGDGSDTQPIPYVQQPPEHGLQQPQIYEQRQGEPQYRYEYDYTQSFGQGFAPGPAEDAQFAEAHARRQVPFEGVGDLGPNLAHVPDHAPYRPDQYTGAGDVNGAAEGHTGRDSGDGGGPYADTDAPSGNAPFADGVSGASAPEGAGSDPYRSLGGSVRSGIPWAPSTPSAAVPQPEPDPEPDPAAGPEGRGRWPGEADGPVPGAGWGDMPSVPFEQQSGAGHAEDREWPGQDVSEPLHEQSEFPAPPEPAAPVDRTASADPAAPVEAEADDAAAREPEASDGSAPAGRAEPGQQTEPHESHSRHEPHDQYGHLGQYEHFELPERDRPSDGPALDEPDERTEPADGIGQTGLPDAAGRPGRADEDDEQHERAELPGPAVAPASGGLPEETPGSSGTPGGTDRAEAARSDGPPDEPATDAGDGGTGEFPSHHGDFVPDVPDESDVPGGSDMLDESDGSAGPHADGVFTPQDQRTPGDAEAPADVVAPENPEAAEELTDPGLQDAPVVDTEHPHTSYILHVNGVDRPVTDAWIGESLLYVLRERLGLAGAKDGCSQGECGACSVQVDGRLVASCLVPSATAAGSDIRTVEGLAADGSPSDVQRALTESGAVQCGFCVPGMAMAVHDLLEGNHKPSDLQTRQAICGNLCRCSGYRGVLDAVRTVVDERESKSGHNAPVSPQAPAPSQAPEAGSGATGEYGAATGPSGGAASGDAARIPHQAGPGAGGVHTPGDGGA